MKNRLFALLLVVALVITVSVFAVGAEETNPFEGATGYVEDVVCPHCGGEAVDWAPVPATTDSQIQNWADYKAGYRHFYLGGTCQNGSSSTLTAGQEICLNLNGQTYQRKSGNVFYTVDGGKLNIMDTSVEKTGKLSLNGASQQYHIYAKNGGEVNVYNATFDNIAASATGSGNGSALRAESGSTITVYEAYLNMGNVTSSYQGGAVYVDNATFVMNKGTITGKCATNGGAICGNKATITLGDVTVTGTVTGKDKFGGAIYVYGGSNLTINGATIKDSAITGTGGTGGGIAISNSTATISGGKIYNNTATFKGHNVWVDGDATTKGSLTLGGTAQIGHDTTVQSSALRGNAIFGEDNCTITIQDNAVIQNFTTTIESGAIQTNSSSATINMTGGTIQNCTATKGGAIGYNVGTKFNFSGGEIKNCTATVAGGAWANYTNYAGSITMSGTAKITNCSAPNGGALYTDLAATMNLNGGTIEGCSATTDGGAVYATTGTINLAGATIKTCSANEGGAVRAAGAKLTMTAGTIDGCTANFTGADNNQKGGGAVKITANTFTFSGGTIKNCTAKKSFGGAIMNVGGTVNLSGGTIDNCSADSSGGAYGASGASSKLNFTAGEIKNCSANDGGALYFQYQSKDNTMSGTAKITACSATRDGGAIVNSGSGNPGLTISGGTIKDCVAGKNGGAISMNANANGDAVIKMTGGRIEGDRTIENAHTGGAVYVNAGNTFELDGGTIYQTRATNYAGAIYAKGNSTGLAKVVFKSGTIEATDCNNNYGGIAMKIYSDLTMSGGIIKNTTNSWTGGALALQAESSDAVAQNITATITGGTIDGCSIDTNSPGAGLYIGKNASATVSGLTVKNCYIAGNQNSGGNVHIAADAAVAPTFENCTFIGGLVNGNYQAAYGGNVFAGKNATFTSCTFTGGAAAQAGGNLHVNSGVTVTINGDSLFTAGKSGNGVTIGGITYNGRGGNISGYNATLNIGGNTVIDGTGTTGVWNGFNINLYGSSTVPAGTLNLSGNVEIKGVDSDKRERSVVIYNNGNVTLDGAVKVNGICFRQEVTDFGVEVKAGYTGEVFFSLQDETLTDAIVPGATVEWVTKEDGYANGGAVKAMDSSMSAKILVDTNEGFKVAMFGAFVEAGTDENGDPIYVEQGAADLSNSSAVEYFKAYLPHEQETTVELTGETYIDMNNSVINFVTNGNKLHVIDNRTDAGKVAAYTKFTVSNEADLVKHVKNEADNKQYLIVGDNENGYTSNRVRVTLDTLAIKPSVAGIYYITTIKTNANIKPYIESYGTAVSLGSQPITEDFLDDAAVLFTEFDNIEAAVNADGNIELTTNSALVDNILKDGADNATRGAMKIKASSFICVWLEGESDARYLMADESFEHSMNDAMDMLDEQYGKLTDAQKQTAQNFYTKWAAKGAFTGLTLDNFAPAV